ncbi:MAG: hypothetical protein H6644_01435 [Caldilineaceae bacterium]|nr:hypothetical protein [Caldilineaceae bacterium]
MLRLAGDDGFRIYAGEGTSYGVNSSYLAWQPIWRRLFAVTPDGTATQRPRAGCWPPSTRAGPACAVAGAGAQRGPGRKRLDAQPGCAARKVSLESLLLDCLRAEVEHAPMVLVLEDCQWLDPLSLDLLEVIGRALETLPVLLLLAYRDRGQEQAHAARIAALPNHRDIALAPLTYAEAREFVAAKFGLTAADGAAVAPALVQRIVDQAEGNPFYIEELINYLLARAIDPTDPGALSKLELPSTLHNLVLSRVDQLSERQKITIKVASVIGRTFQADWLWEAFPALRDRPSTLGDLHALADRELVVREPGDDEHAYFFRHVVTQGVTYESLPYATRSKMHEQFGRFHRDPLCGRAGAVRQPAGLSLRPDGESGQEGALPAAGGRVGPGRIRQRIGHRLLPGPVAVGGCGDADRRAAQAGQCGTTGGALGRGPAEFDRRCTPPRPPSRPRPSPSAALPWPNICAAAGSTATPPPCWPAQEMFAAVTIPPGWPRPIPPRGRWRRNRALMTRPRPEYGRAHGHLPRPRRAAVGLPMCSTTWPSWRFRKLPEPRRAAARRERWPSGAPWAIRWPSPRP